MLAMFRTVLAAITLHAVVMLLAYSAVPLQAKSPPSLYQPASCAEVERAGWPHCHWKWAEVQDECDYTGYYVGGGSSAIFGRGRCAEEGTWGWDYSGNWFHRRVRLDWFYRPHSQGGTGAYRPDGPRVLEALAEKHSGD
jgi:hypothetical protein